MILASASPRRRELLRALGVSFVVRPVETDEWVDAQLEPAEAVLAIADGKAAAALDTAESGAWVLAADTIVVLDGQILGKPADVEQARAMLTALAGRLHEVYTAVVLVGPASRTEQVVCTDVLMRAYSTGEIEASIAAGTPFDKAGGYAIQDASLHPVERFDGCYCNVMGLPLWTVRGRLSCLCPGLETSPPDATYARCARCPLRDSGA